jgi:hypothetical protein
MSSVTDATSSAGERIGAYFNLVSALPSSIFVTFVYALIASGVPLNPPDWGNALAAFMDLGIAGVLLLALSALVLGLVLHPLQFALVQLYEGYWGLSRVAVALSTTRAQHHRRRRKAVIKRGEDAALAPRGPSPRLLVQNAVVVDESARLERSYPAEGRLVMPTRLGNVLRRYESLVGRPYKLDPTRVMAHLGLVSDPSHLKYLNDQRTLLDLAVRLSAMCYLAALILLITLWPYGAWLALAAVAYSLGYGFYRGAIVSAHAYGQAIHAVVDLNRFTLYTRLGLGLPDTLHAERETNAKLARILDSEEFVDLTYKHAGTSPADPPTVSDQAGQAGPERPQT